MEPKKKPEADLTRKTMLFFNIGLVVALGLTICAFEYKVYDEVITAVAPPPVVTTEEVVDVPITDIPPPPQPVVQQPEVVEVPDEVKIEKVDIKLEIEDPPPPAVVEAAVTNAIQVAAPAVEEETEEIFLIVEESAAPAGGMNAFYQYLGKNIKYPEQARRMDVQGRVFVEFVVERDGSLTDVKVIKGIGSGCDEEAIRVVKSAPKWSPGKQRGRPVRQKMHIPVVFKLG